MSEEKREPSPERLRKFEVTPDLVVYKEEMTVDGTPAIVMEKLRELKHKEEIERMWNAERVNTYVPYTEEARRMKMAAKLKNRVEAKHAVIIKREIDMAQKPIALDFDSMQVIKASGEY